MDRQIEFEAEEEQLKVINNINLYFKSLVEKKKKETLPKDIDYTLPSFFLQQIFTSLKKEISLHKKNDKFYFVCNSMSQEELKSLNSAYDAYQNLYEKLKKENQQQFFTFHYNSNNLLQDVHTNK